MRNPYITRNGRAISAGTVTRKTYAIKRSTDSRPLPVHLLCHPKALKPTPIHPYCYETKQWYGKGYALADQLTDTEIMCRLYLLQGCGTRWALYVQRPDTCAFDRVVCFDDVGEAMMYKVALGRHKVE